MSNVATLTLKGTSDLKTIATDLKSVATTAQQAKTPLDGLSKSMDSSSKNATSFGQKLKGFGSQFSSSIASIGALGGTVLNLSRQYQDLGDSQIAVDKAQLKVSKTTEATGKAQGILNGLVAKGVTSGAEYEKALLDVKQAIEAQSLAEQMLKERQEDHQRAQENFWIGLVPTVTSAGASIVSVLNEIGGTKGLGGLKTTLLSFGGKAGGLISGVLSGIGSSASASIPGLSAMTKGVGGLSLAMKGLALSALPVALAIGGIVLVMKPAALLVHEVVSLIKGDVVAALDSVKSMLDFFETIGPIMAAIPGGAAFNVITKLGGFREELAKVRAEAVKTTPAIREIDPALQALDSGATTVSNTIDAFGGNLLGLINTSGQAEAALPPVGTSISGVGTSASTAAPQIETFGGSFATITNNANTAAVSIATVTSQTDPFNAAASIAAKNLAAENSELSLLTKAANAGAKAFQNMAQRQNDLARALSVATQNMNKQYQVASKLGSHLAPGSYNITPGQKKHGMKGQPQGYYRTFRNGVQIASGPGVAPPFKKAASGMHETVNKPTWILAGEAGEERVDIGKPGSGGGFSGTINVYVDGVLQRARYDINKFQGVMK